MAGATSPFIGATIKSTNSSATVNLGPISGLREWQFWEYDNEIGATDGHTAPDLFRRVPWLYRSVQMRAQKLSDIPWSVYRGETPVLTSDKDDYTKAIPAELAWVRPRPANAKNATSEDRLRLSLTDLLHRCEFDLCLTGAAYWQREYNRLKTIGYKRLLPGTITPNYDRKTGLDGFTRRLADQEPITLDLADVAFWWLPNANSEIGPGDPPAVAAVRAAGLAAYIDDFGQGFFKRGAINTTILSVEGNPARDELDRLERWWKRLLGGVKKAFETIAVKATVKPIVVGQAPKDLALAELTQTKREEIATAIGVPESILSSRASNHAVAAQDEWNFYTLTLLPEAELIEQGLNRQVFAPLGYEFRFQPDKLDVFQRRKEEKAYKLLASVIGGVVAVNEMRNELGLPPMDGQDVLRVPQQLGVGNGLAPHTDGHEQQVSLQQETTDQLGPHGAPATSDRQVERREHNQIVGRMPGASSQSDKSLPEVAALLEPFRSEGGEKSYP